MALGEIALAAIADAVLGFVVSNGGDKLSIFVRDKLGQEPTKKAFKAAFQEAYEHFEMQHFEWVGSLFNEHFFQHEGASILAQFLTRDGHPDASDLASCWADSLSLHDPDRRAFYARDLEPVATDFLEDLAQHLKEQDALRELNDSRAFERIASDLDDLRTVLGTGKATRGTRRDYLYWLVNYNTYLDAHGVMQTQRQVQLKLNEIYVSLNAQRDDEPATVDRQILERERIELERRIVESNLPLEEAEDLREQLDIRIERVGLHIKTGKSKSLELAEVVMKHDHLVILGDPGAGKTTLLRYLALMHAQALRNEQTEASKDLGPAHFPILLRIADYAEGDMWKKHALSEFLVEAHTLRECPKRGLADLFQSELAHGNCLILLDGLDEIVTTDERLGIVRRIEDFVRSFGIHGNRFIITSRIAGYRSVPLSGTFTQYTIQDMDEDHIHRFLERWCQAVEDTETPDLPQKQRQQVAQREIQGIMRSIKNAQGVRRLASNPLLLRILALIHRTSNQLPPKRIALYKLATETLARIWRTAHGVPESALVKDEYLTPLLSTLAYWLHIHKPTGLVTEREVYEILGEAWADLNDLSWDANKPNPRITEEVKRFLTAVREHTGLFVERASKRYGFMHLTFEEYYAARHLLERKDDTLSLIRNTHLHNSRWREPILLALGFVGLDYANQANDLLEAAILAQGKEARKLGFTPSRHEVLLGRDFLFALRCLADNIPVRARVREQLLKRLKDEILYNTGPGRFDRYQQELAEQLRGIGQSESALDVAALFSTALMHDTNDNVRYRAAQCLEQVGYGSSEAISSLIHALLHDTNDDVRNRAVESLGRIGHGSSEVTFALSHALLHDTNDNVKNRAVESLGQVKHDSSEVISTLSHALLHDTDEHVRFRAAQGLGQVGDSSSEAISSLIHALLYDSDDNVRYRAAQSLGQVGHGSSQAISSLTHALFHDIDDSVRNRAIESLGQVGHGSSQAISSLTHALLHDTNRAVRNQAVESLGQVGHGSSEAIFSLCHALLHESNNEVRYRATQGLGQVGQGSSEAISSLTHALLHDPDDNVRYRVVESLGQIGRGSSEVVSSLIHALLYDTNKAVRYRAARNLGQVGQVASEAISSLTHALLHDTNNAVRYHAAQGLGQIGQGSPETISSLCHALLYDANYEVRYRAARSLGRVGLASSETVSSLSHALLHDTNNDVRYRAAQSLGQVGQASSETISALSRSLLYDTNNTVRYWAAASLGQVGQTSAEAVSALSQALLHDTNNAVRNQAVESLGQVGQDSSEAVSALSQALLHDTNKDVQNRAVESLGQVGQSQPQNVIGKLQNLITAQNKGIRKIATEFVGKFGQVDDTTIDIFVSGLLDEEGDMRAVCTQALSLLGRRIPDIASNIEMKLLQAIDNPDFENINKHDYPRRSAYNYAYDALWSIVVGEEQEEEM